MTHGPLGKSAAYPKSYDPSLLYPIERRVSRESLPVAAQKLAVGVDFWHCFEASWLNARHVSQAAILRLGVPAHSPCIVESKSLKLYLNSLNFCVFESAEAFAQTVARDVSACARAKVAVELFGLDDPAVGIARLTGERLEDTPIDAPLTKDVDSRLLRRAKNADDCVFQDYHSHLLRSNCPVTDQPDWGSVQIQMQAPLVDKGALLAYVLSYRQHNGFHEACVERIFADLFAAFAPDFLMVRAWYTRRGGIDISPVRLSDPSKTPAPSRLARQ